MSFFEQSTIRIEDIGCLPYLFISHDLVTIGKTPQQVTVREADPCMTLPVDSDKPFLCRCPNVAFAVFGDGAYMVIRKTVVIDGEVCCDIFTVDFGNMSESKGVTDEPDAIGGRHKLTVRPVLVASPGVVDETATLQVKAELVICSCGQP